MATKPRLTINQKGSGDPVNSDGWGTLVKPGELIDIVEVTPLTLNDRRIYNCLLASAWDTIGDDKQHSIRKADLRFNHNGTDRLDASIERLMGAIVKVRNEDGDITRVQLLGANTENERRDGVFRYRFDRELRNIIQNSRVFARIRAEVTFALSSKYALALYEMIQKRGNLEYKHSEEFEIDELRALLGVPKDKLTSFADFKRRALMPAVKEVNALGDFGVSLVPLKTGRAVTGVRLHWYQKSEDELKEAYQELMRHRAGRQARIDGKAETVANEFSQQVIR